MVMPKPISGSHLVGAAYNYMWYLAVFDIFVCEEFIVPYVVFLVALFVGTFFCEAFLHLFSGESIHVWIGGDGH